MTSAGTPLTINVDNAYQAYLADPAQLDEIVQRNIGILIAAEATSGDTVDQLVVIVRPTDYIARSLPPGASTAGMLPARPMAGDLSFLLAVDSPEAIRTAQPVDLKRWHLTEAEAWKRATANIKARLGPLTPIRLGSDAGASGFGAASGLAPSLLADPGICGPQSPDGLHRQVVLVLGRDSFLYADPADHTQTDIFWSEVRRVTASHASLSETPLTCRGGKWVVATPP